MSAARERITTAVSGWVAAGSVAALLLLAPSNARAAGPFDPVEPEGPDAPAPDAPEPPSGAELGGREVRELLTLVYSFGSGHSMGIGYLRSFVLKTGFFAAYTYGLEARLLTRDYTHLDAAVLYATWRLSFRVLALWDVEAGLGGGRSRGEMQGSARLAVHMRIWWVSVGYAFQLATAPTPLPRWYSSHELSVRFEIPLVKTKATRYRRPEGPPPDPALPSPLVP